MKRVDSKIEFSASIYLRMMRMVSCQHLRGLRPDGDLFEDGNVGKVGGCCSLAG